MSRLRRTSSRYSLTVVMLVFVFLLIHPAQAEWHIAGQAGSPFSGSFDHLGGTSGSIEGLRFPQHSAFRDRPCMEARSHAGIDLADIPTWLPWPFHRAKVNSCHSGCILKPLSRL